ncbi:Mss4-like protein [Xylariomycetidae sp. FL2044]|nr:Mss4-like protein [Xylariomycetidae sp. FL2044]
MASTTEESPAKKSGTYEAGCHCGYVKLSLTLSPPLPEYKVLNCSCSACRRFGYLLVYPPAKDVVWHNNSQSRVSRYRFNTKEKDQMFCPQCGASIGIDFREWHGFKEHTLGISVRAINGIDLKSLNYKDLDGVGKVPPAGDLSGNYWDEEKQELK